jgi:hypothetical protein
MLYRVPAVHVDLSTPESIEQMRRSIVMLRLQVFGHG